MSKNSFIRVALVLAAAAFSIVETGNAKPPYLFKSSVEHPVNTFSENEENLRSELGKLH